MLPHIWIILALITASGWAIAETTDDVRMKEQVLQIFDNVQADEIVFEPAKSLLLLLLRGNVRLGTGRADEVRCDLDRKAATVIIRDHDLRPDDRWGFSGFECGMLIERLRARGRLP